MYKPLGGLYLEGRFNGGFFALPVWGAYFWRGLYTEGLIFGILRYLSSKKILSSRFSSKRETAYSLVYILPTAKRQKI